MAAGAALLAAACGSSGTPSSGSSPSTTSAALLIGGGTLIGGAQPDVGAVPGCGGPAGLDHTLTHVTVGQGMGDEIKSDLADVKAKLNTLTTKAHGQWQSQTSAL